MTIGVNIAICTFRRESIVDALRSLDRLIVPPDTRIGVIVADNDAVPSARARVLRTAREIRFPVRYVHAPAGNISIARNACLDAADPGCAWLAFMDDDAVADPHWIDAFLHAAAATGADVLFGPSIAVYPDDAPGWIRRNDFHTIQPVSRRDGVVETGVAGNALITRRDRRFCDARFDHDFGRTGGEDVEFFHRLHRNGARLAIAPAAIQREAVAPARMTLRWLASRRCRTGHLYAVTVGEGSGAAARARRAVPAAGKALYCAARALLCAPAPARAARWALRGLFHAGVVNGCLFGGRPREVYGRTAEDQAD